MPSADVSARVAQAADAGPIGEVQLRAWRASYAALLPAEVLASLGAEELAAQWHQSLVKPQDARQRVLVGLEHSTVRGFVVTAPATDPDCDPIATGELSDLTVDPDHRGAGHGSRLLQAAVDTLVADRFRRAVTWVQAGDDALRGFLQDTGWGPDGAHRTLDLTGDGTTTVKQVRLHTALVD